MISVESQVGFVNLALSGYELKPCRLGADGTFFQRNNNFLCQSQQNTIIALIFQYRHINWDLM